jgi:hypothetical protein
MEVLVIVAVVVVVVLLIGAAMPVRVVNDADPVAGHHHLAGEKAAPGAGAPQPG